MDSNNNDSWAVVGKFGALLAILIACVTLYQFIYPKEASLVAHCSATSIQNTAKDAYLKIFEEEAQDMAAVTYDFPSEDVSPESFKALSDNFSNAFLKVQDRMHQYVNCTVSNVGSKNATNGELNLPETPEMVTSNRQIPEYISGDAIALGTLRPGTNVGVTMWFDSAAWTGRADGYSLVYDNGHGEVEFSSRSFGMPAKAASAAEFIVSNPIFSFFFFGGLAIPLLFMASFAFKPLHELIEKENEKAKKLEQLASDEDEPRKD